MLGENGEVTLEKLEKMEYLAGLCFSVLCHCFIINVFNDIAAVLRETLRLAPVAFFRTISPKEDVVLIGSDGVPAEESANADAPPTTETKPKFYFLKKGTTVVVNTPSMQRDPRVWGPDAEEFRPGRMLDGRFATLPVRPLAIIRL